MAIFWAVLASYLMVNCVANARSVGGSTMQDFNVDDENMGIVQYKDEPHHTLQRRHGNGFSGCQMGSRQEACFPNLCGSKNYHVHFPHHFGKKPSVSVSLAGLDVARDFNLRVLSSAIDVTPYSFNIKYYTWADTKVYWVRFSWIACA